MSSRREMNELAGRLLPHLERYRKALTQSGEHCAALGPPTWDVSKNRVRLMRECAQQALDAASAMEAEFNKGGLQA